MHVRAIAFAGLISVVLFLTLASACSSPNSDEGTAKEPDQKPMIDEFVAKVVSDLGEDDGFAGVARAHDSGYSLAQIVTAGMVGALPASGAIESVSPEFEATGFFAQAAYPGGVAVFASSHTKGAITSTLDISLLRVYIAESETKAEAAISPIALMLLTEMILYGYTAEQITEAFLFGYSVVEDKCDKYWCRVTLRDEKNAIVKPDRTEEPDVFSSEESNSDTPNKEDSGGDKTTADEMTTGSYVGSGTVATAVTSGSFSPPPCTSTETLELKLLEDGKATLTGNLKHSHTSDGDQTIGCEPAIFTYEGTYSDGKLTIAPPYAQSDTITGTYNPDSASWSGEYKVGLQTITWEFQNIPKQ